jgi:hypothetical protein
MTPPKVHSFLVTASKHIKVDEMLDKEFEGYLNFSTRSKKITNLTTKE